MSATTSAPSTTDPSSAPSITTTPPPTNTGPQNSPLLFFVALGFGVVFTNLWIIVGVKYCFRYNARNRARQHDENGDPIDLAAMPQHRRRRREKKLMTLEEVNTRFPILKYKTWVFSRAAQGLPTEGGVSQSRAASIKGAEGIVAPIDTNEAGGSTTATVSSPKREHAEAEASTAVAADAKKTEAEPSTFATTTNALEEVRQTPSHAETADEDDEGIPAAVPGASEMLTAPGDSCAICIDTLEDDDDVRGLSCGHAFHAVCLDPWLTSRRACCPLCKADYYVPKPRAENAENAEHLDPNQEPLDFHALTGPPTEPTAPAAVATAPRSGLSRYMPRLTGRVILPPRQTAASQQAGRPAPGATVTTSEATTADNTTTNGEGHGWMPWRRLRPARQTATPRQLEAGGTAATAAAPATT